MDFAKVQINNYAELIKLPWFEKNGDGDIAVKKDSGVPPILDIHTHLGWSYFGGRVIDYQKKTPETLHYYDYMDSKVELMTEDGHPTKKEGVDITVDVLFVPFRCAPKIPADLPFHGTFVSVCLLEYGSWKRGDKAMQKGCGIPSRYRNGQRRRRPLVPGFPENPCHLLEGFMPRDGFPLPIASPALSPHGLENPLGT